jgi:hypothetical protein
MCGPGPQSKCPFAMLFRKFFVVGGGVPKNFGTQNYLSENKILSKSYARDF